MTTTAPNHNPLYQMEMEVLEEGRQWMRKRLAKKLQQQAQAQGRISPPEPSSSAQHASAPPESSDHAG